MTATTRDGRITGGNLAKNRRLAIRGGEELAEATADEVLAWAAGQVRDGTIGRIAVASSMADTALPHLVAQHIPGVDVIFLDTGYHFPETLATRDELARRVDVTIRNITPELSVPQQDSVHGADLFARDPGACCAMRKVEPLTRTLAGYDAWITGVRRVESPTRAGAQTVEWDATFGLLKINPLVAWTDSDVEDYLAAHDVPTHPLLSQGYPSIGCAPCTRRVEAGQDARSGRWSGFEKTECGLHNRPAQPAQSLGEETR